MLNPEGVNIRKTCFVPLLNLLFAFILPYYLLLIVTLLEQWPHCGTVLSMIASLLAGRWSISGHFCLDLFMFKSIGDPKLALGVNDCVCGLMDWSPGSSVY